MEQVIKLILLANNQRLISEIIEVGSEIGEPDCKLIKPHEIMGDNTLCPWMMEYTEQSEFMISSDKILTLADPNEILLEKYTDLTA